MKTRISAGRPLEPMVVYDPDREIYIVRHPFKQFLIDSAAIAVGVVVALVTGIGIAGALFILIFVNLR